MFEIVTTKLVKTFYRPCFTVYLNIYSDMMKHSEFTLDYVDRLYYICYQLPLKQYKSVLKSEK